MPEQESEKWGALNTSDVPYVFGNELVSRLAAIVQNGRPEAENIPACNPSGGSSLYRIDAGIMREVCPLENEKYQFLRGIYCVN